MAEADIKSNLNKITSKYKYMYHKNEKTSSRLEYVLQKTIFQKPNKKGKHILVNNKTHFKVFCFYFNHNLLIFAALKEYTFALEIFDYFVKYL